MRRAREALPANPCIADRVRSALDSCLQEEAHPPRVNVHAACLASSVPLFQCFTAAVPITLCPDYRALAYSRCVGVGVGAKKKRIKSATR